MSVVELQKQINEIYAKVDAIIENPNFESHSSDGLDCDTRLLIDEAIRLEIQIEELVGA